MGKFKEVRPIFRKILPVIYQDRSKLTYSVSDGGFEGGRITALRLEQATCNHLFDDHPEWFGITEHEGHVLRAYIQGSADREYVRLLHKEFPDIMDEESSDHMDMVNNARILNGLKPFDINKINKKRGFLLRINNLLKNN